ncbi:hypothetical protein K9N68_33190 [Kovacikia minuta CCNUW1]|uniref:hypothetical protein n=1 Tax=Kovacikia minuta TaxID=2931930 RepID=UPI001CCAADD5|nr:hypothetical protein [Kovacikia minuta]UBF26302.1 hypothetical protein K9N68_33190 [Kovacikia minuta CCNUW1]
MKRSLTRLVALASSSAYVIAQTLFLPTPTQAQTFEGTTGCPAGTSQSGTNFIFNGNFNVSPGGVGPILPGNPAGFTSTLPYRGDGVYPDDSPPAPTPLGGLSIQTGAVSYFNNQVIGQPFPGDTSLNVPPSNTYLYSNPNAAATTPRTQGSAFNNPVIWRQVVAGLRPNTTYNFQAFFYDLLAQGAFPGAAAPFIQLQVGSPGAAPTLVTPPQRVQPRQQWQRIEISFTTAPGQTSLELTIVDQANTIFGDDFGFTAIGLRECFPTIGVSKQAGTPVSNGDGTFTIPYTVVVRNFGPPGGAGQYDLLNLQLSDTLSTTFANATSFSIQSGSISSPTLTVNPNFNGSTNTNLLQGSDILEAGTSETVTFNVIVTPGTGPNGFGVFENQVSATASSRGGTPVNARSSNGASPDQDNNGRPDPPTPTPVELPRGGGGGGDPRFLLVKRITGVNRSGAALPGVNFNTFVDDTNTSDDNAPGWSQLSTVGIIDLDAANPLRSGDEVTYTVYYLSNGGGTVSAATVCDPIPNGTQYVANSAQVSRANAPFVPSGAFFPPLATLPPNNSCIDQTNSNGTVIFDVGDVPNTAGSNFGYVRFRVKIN